MSLFSLLVMSSSSNASVPPYYDRINQIKTVVESQEVANVFNPSSRISHIAKISDPKVISYSLATEEGCTLIVELEVISENTDPSKPVKVGPTHYKVSRLSPFTCLPVPPSN